MKKYTILLLVTILVLSLTACTKSAGGEGNTAESAAAEVTETVQGDAANSENPMAMVMDDAEYAEKLGIAVDTTKIPVGGMGRYIVNDEIVYFCFGVQDGENESADVLLHATKNKDLKDTLLGDFGTEVKRENIKVNGVNVEQTDMETDGTVFHQYAFEKDGIYYCLVVRGEISEELFNTLFASFLEAVRPA